MLNLRLLQLKSDFKSAGYMIERPDPDMAFYGFDYFVTHWQTGLLVGGLLIKGNKIEYDPFPYTDIEENHYSEQARVIFEARNRLVYCGLVIASLPAFLRNRKALLPCLSRNDL